MAGFLFWNLNRKPLQGQIRALCDQHAIDVLVLAESAQPDTTLLQHLNDGRDQIYVAPYNPSNRLRFFVRFPSDSLELVSDEGGVAIRRVKPPVGADILLVAVHLRSKLYSKDVDQAFNMIRVAEMISAAESRFGHKRTLVLGDLNVNPFEYGMVAGDGLHAVMDKELALQIERTINGRSKLFFYNPMWSRMGDESEGPPGTYYYRHSENVCYFWNTFDQFLIRPELLPFYRPEYLKVITEVNEAKFVKHKAPGLHTTYSDHLPIFLKLDIERGP